MSIDRDRCVEFTTADARGTALVAVAVLMCIASTAAAQTPPVSVAELGVTPFRLAADTHRDRAYWESAPNAFGGIESSAGPERTRRDNVIGAPGAPDRNHGAAAEYVASMNRVHESASASQRDSIGTAPNGRPSYESTGRSSMEGMTDWPAGGHMSPAGSFSPPGSTGSTSSSSPPATTRSKGSTTTIASSLAVVIGCFLLFVWVLRRAAPRSSSRLPRGVVEVLGRAPLDARRHLQLVRLGDRALLIVVGPSEVRTLCEVDRPEEVDRLLEMCDPAAAAAAARDMREALRRFSAEASHGTPAGATSSHHPIRARRRAASSRAA